MPAIVVVTTALSCIALAQEGVVGRAVNTAGQPIPGVTVLMIPATGGTPRRTTTGGDGTYRFEKVPDGVYRVDLDVLGFDVTRRNHLRVRNGASAVGDATLKVSPLCECVVATGLPRVVQRSGRVVDHAGRPLPRARLELTVPLRPPGVAYGSTWREVRYADTEGRFSVNAPIETSWRLTVSDSGFRPVTQQISGSSTELIVFKLSYIGLDSVAEHEILNQGCRCGSDLFTHRIR